MPILVYAASALTLTTVDSTGSVGYYTSITLGADNFAVVSYYDLTNRDLKVLKCGNAACSSSNTITTVDATNDVGTFSSIALGIDDYPIMSYYTGTDRDLKVLKCGNAACSSGNTITTVDSTGDVGSASSIAIGADNNPVISFYDTTNFTLKFVQCGNAACSSGNTVSTIDATGDVGIYNSITLGADDYPVISYHDNGNNNLKVLKCGNAACSSGNTITTVDSTGNVGEHISITLGADDYPVISYYDVTNSDLKVLKCGNAACSSGNTITTVDSTGFVGFYTSIALGADGYPIISYRDYTNLGLKVLKCGNAACSSGNTDAIVDSDTNAGEYSSITLGVDGYPIVSYYDNTNTDLKILACADPTCVLLVAATAEDSSNGGAWRHRVIRLRYAEIAAGLHSSAEERHDTKAPSLSDVGISIAGTGSIAAEFQIPIPEEKVDVELSRKSKIVANMLRQQGQSDKNPAAESQVESALSPFEERVCARVWKRFSGQSLDRVNERLEKRLGFTCNT